MPTKQKLSAKQAEQAAKALEVLFATEYVDKRKLYVANFLRGMFFSAGSIIGASILIVVGVWILSLFDTVPFVGPIVESFRHSIEQSR